MSPRDGFCRERTYILASGTNSKIFIAVVGPPMFRLVSCLHNRQDLTKRTAIDFFFRFLGTLIADSFHNRQKQRQEHVVDLLFTTKGFPGDIPHP